MCKTIQHRALFMFLGFFCLISASSCGKVKKNTGGNEVSQAFVSVWRTDVENQTITLPLRSGYNYDFTVDWGDGSSIDHVTSSSDPLAMHMYEEKGTYEVTIEGLVESWYFNNTGDKEYIIEVKNLGDVGWKNLESAFHGCGQLSSFAGGNTSEVTSMRRMFYSATFLVSLDVSSFDTSKVTDMSGMFFGTYNVTSLDVSKFDTSKVIDMHNMFAYVASQSLDVSSFNTSMVENMSAMFYAMSSLLSLDLTNFDTSKVTDMSHMFSQMVSISMLDLSTFDTSQVVDMRNMFALDENLSMLNLNNWDISNVSYSNAIFLNTGANVSGGLSLSCTQMSGSLFGKTCI
ncbi:MAG: BspA family leucine-rich repeat surface protein [Bdellovibrionales bacterium]|nr:BspA family leucine-rich repeat surface protein [Bdellovibrionales bacterium]